MVLPVCIASFKFYLAHTDSSVSRGRMTLPLLDSKRRMLTSISYHQLLVLASNMWKTSFLSQLSQFQWNVVPFSLQGSVSLLIVLMQVINEALSP